MKARSGTRWSVRSAADRERSVPLAAAHVRGGGLLVYPTETVYGLGALVSDTGVAAVGALKGRGSGAPFLALLPWTEGGVDELRGRAGWGEALAWTSAATRLAAAAWPGPVTLILDDPDERWPAGMRNAGGGVGVRVSPHPFVRELLAELEEPLLSTSANRTGEPVAPSAEEVERRLAGQPGWDRVGVVDAGPLPDSPPSTVVDCTGVDPRILREGAFPRDEILRLIETTHE